MADFLTECPGSSDFPDEEVKWKPVDASEPELEKAMATLSTKPKEEKAEPSPTSPVPLDKMEPDFSAPDKAPDADVIVDDSGSKDPLPSSTTSSPSTGLPSTQSVPKSAPVVKSAPKAPPSKAQAELEKLKPFLRFNDGADSDAAPSLPARSSTSVPKKPALKPRSQSPGQEHRLLLVIVHALACPRSVTIFIARSLWALYLPRISLVLPSMISILRLFTSWTQCPLTQACQHGRMNSWLGPCVTCERVGVQENGHGSTSTLPFTSTTQPTSIPLLTQGHLRRAPLPETLLYLKGTAVGLAKT